MFLYVDVFTDPFRCGGEDACVYVEAKGKGASRAGRVGKRGQSIQGKGVGLTLSTTGGYDYAKGAREVTGKGGERVVGKLRDGGNGGHSIFQRGRCREGGMGDRPYAASYIHGRR